MTFARTAGLFRLAGALLHPGTAVPPGVRREAARRLREASMLADQMGARPLAESVEALAIAARIPLGDPEPKPRPRQAAHDGARLTSREREVLTHLGAGRSYAEIGGALFISDKTVSVHVSNLLRKTGAGNRIELAAWARRQGLL
jgi:DNA-binding NarL/FixJ family response regulator